jgi:hypothetical protein
MISGKPHYAHPKYEVYDSQVQSKTLLATVQGRAVAWKNNARLSCYDGKDANVSAKVLAAWLKPRVADLKPIWESDCKNSLALAVGPNAVAVATQTEVATHDLQNGTVLWRQPLPAPPVPWGLCVDRRGNVIVSLETGTVLSFGPVNLASQ